MRCLRFTRTDAFTRVEALAVIATVLVLALLSFPVSANNRAQSKTTLCFSNLRHLIFAWQLYASDHDGILVGNYFSGGQLGSTNTAWARGYMDWTNNRDNTNLALIRDPRSARLANYILTARNVHKCPADTFQSSVQRRLGMVRLRSVVMNSTIGPGDAQIALWDPLYRQARTMAQIYNPGPSESTVFLEEHPDSINDPFFVSPLAQRWLDFPASYHQGAAAVTFADGHVGLHSWRTARIRNAKVQFFFGLNGSAPRGDPDLTWMSYSSQRSGPQTF
jgi:prepilin-type processing-associated H-X9-DG protein